MGERTDQIREEIERVRNRLGQNLNQLEYRVRQTTDWRVQFDRHPWVFVGAAFSGALALGWMIGHPRRAIEREPSARAQRRDHFRTAPAGRD